MNRNKLSASVLLHRKNFSLDINLQVEDFQVLAVFGPSGSGKTTLLRSLAGFEKTQGKVYFNEHDWNNLQSWQRPLAYVFQDGNLFPHLSVQGNLDYAIKRNCKAYDENFYEQVLGILKLNHLLTQNVDTLSGGETQRVAIARALLRQPELLLLDEPLASIDAQHKQELLNYLCELKRNLGIAMVYVSHSIEEIAHIADVICVLDSGSIQAQGSPTELLQSLDFNFALGREAGVVWEGKITQIDDAWQLACFQANQCQLSLPLQGFKLGEPLRVRILAKDVSITLSESSDSSILNRLRAQILEISDAPNSSSSLLKLECNQQILLAQITQKSRHQLKLKTGMQVWAQLKSLSLHS